MARLHQIIAVEKSVKSRAEKALTEAYHLVQKPELFVGLTRTYEPLEDTGEQKPAESKKIQFTAKQMIDKAREAVTELLDVTATKDSGNTQATGSVVVGGSVLLSDVPVTTLLFLEKRLTDIRTFVTAIPVLDSAESWDFEPSQGYFVTKPSKSGSNKKVAEVVTLAPATEKHPAQAQIVNKDVLAGYWTQRKLSAALPAPEQAKFLARVDALIRAVKLAREEANASTVDDKHVGAKVFAYIFD